MEHRVKRTQCDYTLTFKLAVVSQVEKVSSRVHRLVKTHLNLKQTHAL